MARVDLSAWQITPLDTRRAPLGLNNDSYFVSAREGEFVLRVYRNTSDPARVRDEHDLLARLAAAELPFAVPAPTRTVGGDTLAVLESPEGPRFAALFARIPGEPAAITIPNARLAGAALAALDRALAQLDLPVRAPAALRDVHRLVPDPAAALEELPLTDGHRLTVARILDRVEHDHDLVVRSLPRQITHGDFAFVNLLLRNDRVTGLLDFEFSAPDVRAADLASALYVVVVRGPLEERWRLIDALAAGYRRVLWLDPMEIGAVPALMLRRSATGLIHWIGRWRQQIAPADEPVERATRIVAFTEWLDANAARLAVVAAGGIKSAP